MRGISSVGTPIRRLSPHARPRIGRRLGAEPRFECEIDGSEVSLPETSHRRAEWRPQETYLDVLPGQVTGRGAWAGGAMRKLNAAIDDDAQTR